MRHPVDRGRQGLIDPQGLDVKISAVLSDIHGVEVTVTPVDPDPTPDPGPELLLVDVTARTGADDLFLFRRIEPGRYVHLGGFGRGIGWAGIVELDLRQEPTVAAAVSGGSVARISSHVPVHVVGPYHARGAAIVPVNDDVFVVVGSGDRAELCADDDELGEVAALALSGITHVSPAKRLADELEVLHAVQAMSRLLPGRCAAKHVARVAAESLTCDVAVLVTDRGRSTVWRREDAGPQLDADGWVSALLAVRPQESRCEQDAARAPLPAPYDTGVSSYFVLPLPEPARGTLVLLHLDARPRGFTSLCQELGHRLVEAAVTVLHTTALQEQLQERYAVAKQAAFVDALTGVGNRAAWTRALKEHDGRAAGVVVADVDGLKAVNDQLGHDEGDRQIQTVAELLHRRLREGQTLARIGGDEFAVLLPGADQDVVDRFLAAFREDQAASVAAWGLPAAASAGACLSEESGSLLEAFRCADKAMYDDKLASRVRR